MTWNVLIEDEAERASVLALAKEIGDAVAVSPLSKETAEMHADHALMRAYLGSDEGADDDLGAAALADAIGLLSDKPSGPGLYGGAAKIGFAVAHLAAGDDADAVCSAIDRSLIALLDGGAWPHYDLISGPVGFLVYAFERIDRDDGRALARRLLGELERSARPRGAGLGWFTAPETLPAWQREIAPHGYWNLGLAHGVPGVIGVLARCITHGVDAPRARRLLDGAVAHLLEVAPPRDDGRFVGWIAEGKDAPVDHQVRRAAWCYGDLGASMAILAAAQATGRDDWRREAIDVALGVARCPVDQSGVADAGLCHGGAGVVQCLNRMYQATGERELGEAARAWLRRTLAMRRPDDIGGFPSAVIEEGTIRFSADASLLTGAPGVALALAAACGDLEPSWDRLLLADLTLPA